MVIVRLLGGESYWPYGVERLTDVCAAHGHPHRVAARRRQTGCGLAGRSTLPPEAAETLGATASMAASTMPGMRSATRRTLIGRESDGARPGRCRARASIGRARRARARRRDGPLARRLAEACVVLLSGAAAGRLARARGCAGCGAPGRRPRPAAIFVTSLRDKPAAELIGALMRAAEPRIVLNATGFAVSRPARRRIPPSPRPACRVLQAIFAGATERQWRARPAASPRDIAMNVALPEVDGRILTRAVAFKTEARFDEATEAPMVVSEPNEERCRFVAALAAAWVRLARAAPAERRIALVLANYPNRDGRIGNGVGLDTPASTVRIMQALKEAGYRVENGPVDGAALMARLTAGPTNAADSRAKPPEATLPLADYAHFFNALPAPVQATVAERWGEPEADPFFRQDVGCFALPVVRFGNVVVAIQPARGYNIDPEKSYHDPDLPPPHGYLAFYAWVRTSFDAHAVVHVGKHGNVEWLPGKALALSAECFPEAALGPLPHVYPFIVNDPGEGSQAKRRGAAVIVDHLTPPLTRAGSHGALEELERLVDEFFDAASVDPRRCPPLSARILELAASIGLDQDCGIHATDGSGDALRKLDGYLCEIKEMQIRDGLHIFGEAPAPERRNELLRAIARSVRGPGAGEASLLRALADDLALGIDPLSAPLGEPWRGPRPQALTNGVPWRSTGDTVERLEGLAASLIAGTYRLPAEWRASTAVLHEVTETIGPALDASADAETAGLLTALDGRFVPTAAAWQLGWASAQLLVEHYAQTHGDWPRAMALSAWGTSNMRTGGDDIAQALALIGARPRWEGPSGRVTGFEIMPLDLLDRPRVDVTLRVSGFFRDAFPGLIDLFDSAVRAVAALDEGADDNPLAAKVAADAAQLAEDGAPEGRARRLASYRVFGSKPGAYGAGLQALIDERGWTDASDLAQAYVAWGGWAYGAGEGGAAEHALFERRLGAVEAVVQNQDNREHDLLDSDDYYQFEGGLAAAVTVHAGRAPALYHNDHSVPDNPRIRTLADELGRVVRARVTNPKWIAGVMRHGYKGAFEIAATVDYLFAFAATTGAVKDHHFDAVFDAYVADEAVRDFMEDANPAALRELAERLLEAQERSLWRPRANHAHALLAALRDGRQEAL
ncbi:Aerobic cobaltochelatase subunit CobN [Geodia barretti]|uniref:Aerobic cobaltochelatase subunit CobN n=1 Tax=Geodia barretti TaxID=519541 RepID=A0AA35XKQ8_GEOBA|nr:Aerobic cobaltochelatase subunit CobN [Geodia barretti]